MFCILIMKQITEVVIHFLSEAEFLRKASLGAGSDVRGQRTHFKLLVFRKAQPPTEMSSAEESPVINLWIHRDASPCFVFLILFY